MRLLRITLIMMLGFAFQAFAQGTIVLSSPGDMVSKVSTSVLTEAYQRLGIQVQTKTLPAERALYTSNNGDIDGEVSRVKGIDKKYSNLVMVPVAINLVEGVVFSKDASFTVDGWQSLKPYSIGIRKGTKFAEKGTQGMSVQSAPTNKHLFLKLQNGRTDIAVTSRIEGLQQMKTLQITDVEILEPAVVTLSLYHYLHKSKADLVPQVTKVLEEMAAEGRIKAIRQEAIAELN